jgi:hypothetical protein
LIYEPYRQRARSQDLPCALLAQEAENGDRAFIVHEAHTSSGKTFSNSEVHRVRNGKLIARQVYFGWSHPSRRILPAASGLPGAVLIGGLAHRTEDGF